VNALELVGQVRTHIHALEEPPCHLNRDAVTAFLALRRAASREGIDLVAQSSFRDFERQLLIWNGKWTGERPMNDANGQPLDTQSLSAAARVDAILLWSALPGASRHHWGTDLDLIDRQVVAAGHRVQLTPAEFAPSGPFGALFAWLEAHAARFGFFRPYRGVRSGVQGEPWHYSFAPLAEPARRALTVQVLRDAIAPAPLQGKEEVLKNIEALHARYVARIDWP
jgi:LAS superfamily LD-carboxypeptidase LdcB